IIGGMPVGLILAVACFDFRGRKRPDDGATAEIADRDGGSELLGEYLLRRRLLIHHRREPGKERVAVVVIGVQDLRRRARGIVAIAMTAHCPERNEPRD